jgi:hypothetical protein
MSKKHKRQPVKQQPVLIERTPKSVKLLRLGSMLGIFASVPACALVPTTFGYWLFIVSALLFVWSYLDAWWQTG